MSHKPKTRIPMEGYLAIIFTAILVSLLSLQVFFRFFLGKSISWAEEVARFAFVWSIYCSIIYAANLDKHIRVTMHLQFLSAKIQRGLLTIADLLWVVFVGTIAVVGADFVWNMFKYPYISQTTGINLAYIYLIVPLGFTLLAVRIVQSILRRFKSKIEITDSRLDM